MSRQARLFDLEVPISEELRPAVDLWLKHKAERRENYKPTGLAMLIERMAELGADRAMAAVRHSIANNWSGLFEPKADKHESRQQQVPDIPGLVLPEDWSWLSRQEQRLILENAQIEAGRWVRRQQEDQE